jgi:hypothetical protein
MGKVGFDGRFTFTVNDGDVGNAGPYQFFNDMLDLGFIKDGDKVFGI